MRAEGLTRSGSCTTRALYSPRLSLPPTFRHSYRGSAPDEQLYNEEDLEASMDKIEVVDFLQTLNVNGILVRLNSGSRLAKFRG